MVSVKHIVEQRKTGRSISFWTKSSTLVENTSCARQLVHSRERTMTEQLQIRRGINYVVTEHTTRVELYIDRGQGTQAENKAVFDQLLAKKAEIDATFGER